jgi:hypothetical protein
MHRILSRNYRSQGWRCGSSTRETLRSGKKKEEKKERKKVLNDRVQNPKLI